MKKIISIILALTTMCALFAGCNLGNNKPTEPVVTEARTIENVMIYPESPAEDFNVSTQDGDTILYGYSGDDEIVVIPESLGVTHIAKFAFANSTAFKAIRLSNSIQYIEEGAFADNNDIELVICGSGVKEIGISAFQDCDNLTRVVLNDGLVKIERMVFTGSRFMSSVEIPSTVEEIAMAAFHETIDGFFLVGEAGSYAEEYAKEYEIPFKVKEIDG